MANEKRIESLTPEQEALLDVYYQQGLEIGLCTEPSDRAGAEEWTRQLYATHGLAEPAFEWVASPLAGLKRAEELDPGSGWATVGYGQHSISFLAWAMYCREVLGLTAETEEIVSLYEIAKRTGWYWCWEHLVLHSERPRWVLTDERGNLHSTEKHAIEYPDGWGFSAVHGVFVPDWLIEKYVGGCLSAEDIKQLTNAEQQRVGLELYGYERWIHDVGATLVHEDAYGQLYSVPPNDLVVLVTDAPSQVDGTRGRYALRVDSQCRPLLPGNQFGEPQALTARNAVASTWGLRGTEYAPEVET